MRSESARVRKLEKSARRALRNLKVGVDPAIMREVLAAESRATGTEVAIAYVVTVARRAAAGYVTERPEDLREFAGRRLVNFLRRIEKRDPVADLPPIAGELGAPPKILRTPSRQPSLYEDFP